MYWVAMEYLGDKLSVAHSQVSGWVGNVRRSLHGAISLLSTSVERGGRREDGTGDFKRTNSLRSLASRSRESIRRFSLRSQQRLSLRRRTAPNTPTAVRQHTHFKVQTHTPGKHWYHLPLLISTENNNPTPISPISNRLIQL